MAALKNRKKQHLGEDFDANPVPPINSTDDEDIEPGGSAPLELETPSKHKHINFFEDIEKMVNIVLTFEG